MVNHCSFTEILNSGSITIEKFVDVNETKYWVWFNGDDENRLSMDRYQLIRFNKLLETILEY